MELTKGTIYTVFGQIGNTSIGYMWGTWYFRYLYKVAQHPQLKAFTRLWYNVLSLPMTIYSRGWGNAFDLFKISKLEEM